MEGSTETWENEKKGTDRKEKGEKGRGDERKEREREERKEGGMDQRVEEGWKTKE